MEEIVTNKLELVLAAIKDANENIAKECEVEHRQDGSVLIYGPFPSFLILVEPLSDPTALIHVNADAPNLAYLFTKINSYSKQLAVNIDGPFAVDESTGAILMGPSAYAKKEENILMFAQDIMSRRAGQSKQEQGILVPDKKIIVA